MGAVNTTYTFTATDTITSAKMNNIIDQTTMTGDAVLGGSGGSGGLDISSGKLSISANAINNSRLAAGSVAEANIVNGNVTTAKIADSAITSAKIADGAIVNADINASAAIAGTKISPNFGSQSVVTTGNIAGGVATASAPIHGQRASASAGFAVLAKTTGVSNESGLYFDASNNSYLEARNGSATLTISIKSSGDSFINGGDLGIGTSNPDAKLDVRGSVQTKMDSNGGTALTLNNEGVAGGKSFVLISTGSSNGSGVGHFEIFAPDGGNVNFATTGNVGIGTQSPTEKLDVNGNAKANTFIGNLTGTASAIANDSVTNVKVASGAAIVGTKISPNFGSQNVTTTGNITTTGSIGAGTLSPSVKLHVVSGSNPARFESNTTESFVQLFTNEGNNNRVEICNRTGGRLALYTTGGGDALNILKTGEVGIGTTTPSQKLDVNGTTQSTKLVIDNTSNDDKVFIKGFNNNNTDDGIRFVPSIVTEGDTAAACSFMSAGGTTLRGTISITTSGVNYGSVSDYRLKTDFIPISGALQQLQQLNPVNFKWIESEERSDGFIAHEVQSVIPSAVCGNKDAEDSSGNPIYQQVDYSKLVPILVASVQELSQKVAELEAR